MNPFLPHPLRPAARPQPEAAVVAWPGAFAFKRGWVETGLARAKTARSHAPTPLGV